MCASARATTITVSSYSVPNWQYGAPASVRIYVNSTFIDSAGILHVAQATGGLNFYQSLTCSVSGTTVTLPSFTIASTTDSPTNPSATYSFILYSGTIRKDTLAASFKVPIILGTTITFGSLAVYNSTHPNPPGPQYPDIQQVQALISQVLPVADASDVIKGKTKLSVAAAVSTNPIAVGDNDVRVVDALSYASLAAAITAIGSTPTRLNISSAQTISASVSPPATLQFNVFGAGSITVASGQTFHPLGPFTAPSYQVFYGAGSVILSPVTTPGFLAAWWGEKTVTVPGPTLAPTLTETAMFGGGTFVNGVTYQVAYSYVAWNGETGLSPVTSFTAKNGQAIGVLPKASLATNAKYAVGAYVYISPDAGVNFYRADGAFTRPALISFGDDTAGWGGALIDYGNSTSGATPQAGGATTTTKTGIVVPVPPLAPTVVNLGANAAATYYGAFSYLCGDGTETALSPVSSGLVAAGQSYIRLQRNEEPPSGAVAVRLYFGTSATPSALHLQTTVPLHYVRSDLHDYSTGGAAPLAGAAQSAICNLQQAYDSMMESGSAGRIKVGAGTTAFKVPLILRLKNSGGTQVGYVKIEGVSGAASPYSSGGSVLSYTGTQSTAVVAIAYSTSNLEYRNIVQRDPNSRLSVGLAACDYTGGGGFESDWHSSVFEAYKAGGVGYQIPVQACNSGSHTSSEQHFYECVFDGDAWGTDIHGGQTTNIQFVNCETLSNGNTDSANSGQMRIATVGVSVRGWEGTGAAIIGYVFFLTRDVPHPAAGGYGLAARDVTYDAVAGSSEFIIHVSAVAVNTGDIAISDSLFASTITDRYALYSGSSPNLTLSNVQMGGNGWINWINTLPDEAADRSVIDEPGADTFFGLGSTYGFKISSNTTTSVTNNADKVKAYVNKVLLSRAGTNNTSPATLSGNVNNYNPGGLSYYQRWDSDASRNVTGLSFSGFQVDGETHLITNIGLNDIVLKHQSGSSTAANRFYNSTGTDITLAPKQSASVIYDATNQYWIVTATSIAIKSALVGVSTNASGTIVVGASVTTYNTVGASLSTSWFSTTEAGRQAVMPYAGTLKNLYVVTTTAQPGDGTLVITVRKNGVDTAAALTIAINAAAGIYRDTTHSVAFAAGDLLSIKFVNASGSSSAGIASFAVEFDSP